MNIENVIENLYEHICLPKPDVILLFPSIKEAFSDYKNWCGLVEEVTTCFWQYQFPMAIPSSYWASFHLKKEKYKLDLKRSPNENGCFVYSDHINDQAGATLTNEEYDTVCSDLAQESFDSSIDKLVENILEKYEAEIDLFAEYMHKEDPSNQMGIDDFIFLGNFEWLQQELWFLNRCKEEYGVSINESMLETLKQIQNSNKLLITFSNLVVVAELN